MVKHILIVDDEEFQRNSFELIVKNILEYNVTTIDGGQKAINYILSDKGRKIDLILLDMAMPEVDGIDVLEAVKPFRPDIPVIILSGYGYVQKAVEAMQKGATDFVEKQESPERLLFSITNALKLKDLEDELDKLRHISSSISFFSDIIGSSSTIRDVMRSAKKASKHNISVMIEGESGVGKEVFARSIHNNSNRSGESFVAVNCGALPENLVESILFGHEKGAFTGAIEKNIGKFREANGGTLFLDEVGELKLNMQVKLLRTLQEGEVEPVGASMPQKVDVRIISATNKDLAAEVSNGFFREDLFYRLNVYPILIPPLRERKEDISELIDYFIKTISLSEKKKIKEMSEEVREVLSIYNWPGNIRQLRNAVYRAIIISESEYFEKEDFLPIFKEIGFSGNDNIPIKTNDTINLIDEGGDYREFANIEEDIIRNALEFYNWKISEAARKLSIGRSTLYRKIDDYNIKIETPNNEETNLK